MLGYAVVTGASRGIGEAFARLLAEEGWPLLLTARSEEALETLAKELHDKHDVSVEVVAADLAQPGGTDAIARRVSESELPIELLVNNAGFSDYAPFREQNGERIREMMQLNMSSLVALTHQLLPHMLKRGRGGILNVASTAAFQGIPGMSVYSATKAFVLNFSEGLSEELETTGVKVTVLCPGPTKTNFLEAANMEATSSDGLFEAPEDVARRGLDALRAGDTVRVSGMLNSLGVLGTRILPRKTVVKIANSVFQKTTRSTAPPPPRPKD